MEGIASNEDVDLSSPFSANMEGKDMGALSEFSKRRFGTETRHNDTPLAIVVGAAATALWRNNPDRLSLLFVNLGANVIYLNVGPDVAAANGIYLGANGGSVSLTAEEDGELVGYPWWGIAAGNTNIFSAELEGA